MVVYIKLGSVTGNLVQGFTRGAVSSSGDTPWPADDDGKFYEIVDAFGRVLGTKGSQTQQSANYQNLLRYCEYPGLRLLKRVNFQVNGNPLDEYYDYTVAMLGKFCVPHNKKIGYNRLCGQEVEYEGYTGPMLSAISDTDDDHDLFPPTGGLPQTQIVREKKFVVNGPQTPQLVQPKLEIWSKLRFWFNEDVRLSVPSVSIPYGNRFITMDLQAQNLLLFEFPGAYLKTYSFVSTPQKFRTTGTNVPGTQNLTITYSPIWQPSTIPDVKIEYIEMYVNNIFVNAEIHDIFIKRIGFSLIRVFRHHVASVNQDGSQSVRLDNLKWPIEYMFVGLRPTWNIKDLNPNQWRDWHRMTRMVDATFGNNYDIEIPDDTGPTSGGLLAKIVSDKIVKDSYAFPVNSVNSITVTSHAIQIYDDYGVSFFNSYMPYHYGGPALNTPEDPGALFVNFALFPRSYQPSGHFNMSRARETFIGLNSSPKQEATVSRGTCGNVHTDNCVVVQPPSPYTAVLAF